MTMMMMMVVVVVREKQSKQEEIKIPVGVVSILDGSIKKQKCQKIHYDMSRYSCSKKHSVINCTNLRPPLPRSLAFCLCQIYHLQSSSYLKCIFFVFHFKSYQKKKENEIHHLLCLCFSFDRLSNNDAKW